MLLSRTIVGLIAALGLSGCNLREAETAEQRAAHEAAEKVERMLFSDPVKAKAELDRRLRSFLSVRDGVLIVRDGELDQQSGDGWYALPLHTPWNVSCTNGWLEFKLGTQNEDGEAAAPTPEIISAILPHDRCEQLAVTLGHALAQLLQR
jgi:hypothetical protein